MNNLNQMIMQRVLQGITNQIGAPSPASAPSSGGGIYGEAQGAVDQRRDERNRKALRLAKTLGSLYAAGRIGLPYLNQLFSRSGGTPLPPSPGAPQGPNIPRGTGPTGGSPPLGLPEPSPQPFPTGGGNFPRPGSPTPSSGGLSPSKRNITDYLLKGINLESLSERQRSRIGNLISQVQEKEVNPNGLKRLRTIIGNIARSKGLVEEEGNRFEEAYPEAVSKASQIPDQGGSDDDLGGKSLHPEAPDEYKDPSSLEYKPGDLVNMKTGKNPNARVLYSSGKYVVVEQDGKKRKVLKSTVSKTDKLDSAPIEDYMYDNDKGNLFVKFRGGKKTPSRTYVYPGLDLKTFNKFAKGKAKARTEGEFAGRRWWKGKDPTLGGAFWKYIRGRDDYSALGEDIDFEEAIREFLNLQE